MLYINFTHSLTDGEEERVPKGEIESSIFENRGIPSSFAIMIPTTITNFLTKT